MWCRDKIKVAFNCTNSYPLHLCEYLDFLKSYLAKNQSHLQIFLVKVMSVENVFQQLGKVVFKKPDSKENHHYISNFRKSYQQIISYFTKSRLCNSFSQVKWSSGMLSLFFGCIVSPENAFYTFRNADLRNTSSNGTFFLSFWDLGFSFHYYFYTYYCILVLHAKSTLNLVSKVEQQTKARTKYLLLFPQMLLLYLLHSPKNSPWSQKYVFLSAILLDCILQESFFNWDKMQFFIRSPMLIKSRMIAYLIV